MKIPTRHLRLVCAVTVLLATACGDGDPTRPESSEFDPSFGVAAANRSNTLAVCHTMGNGAVRELRVNASSRADHMGHGDWLPMEFFEDADDDGYGGSATIMACVLPPGYSEIADDCDDGDATSYPGAPEIVGDHKDNDCDGWVDEGWAMWGNVATDAARRAAREWMVGAAVRSDRCLVNAAVAVGGPGSVVGPSVAGKVRRALLESGASDGVASAWGGAFDAAWHGWSDAITIPALPWYPSFVAWPGPSAPSTPNNHTPLSLLVSPGASRMGEVSLRNRVASALGSEMGAPGAEVAVDAFAEEISSRFRLSQAIPVTMVMGSGRVPTFAPPFVPVGPVVNGTCVGGNFPVSPWN